MQKTRLDNLADGIFAIVMTLLVLELRVPELVPGVSLEGLWNAVGALGPPFVSYAMSFLVLFTYWIAHNYIVSSYATNVTRTFASLNIPFLMFVGLVPFSSHFLGLYHATQIGIVIYGANIILIGLSLALLIFYATKAKDIKNDPHFSKDDIHRSYIRAFLPLVAAVVAIAVSFVSTTIPLFVLAIGFLFNLFPRTLHAVLRATGEK